jgi:YHS domain-containing protein
MKKLFILLVLPVILMTGASAQQAVVRKAQYNVEKSGLAIQGYDPVAYFLSNKAIEGKQQITAEYNGLTYRFTNELNKETFKANPAKYEPQYGGWCAYAMGAKGEKVEIDPETFKVVDGKLYLFYNKFFNNTLPSWNKDEANLKTHADEHWKKFVK